MMMFTRLRPSTWIRSVSFGLVAAFAIACSGTQETIYVSADGGVPALPAPGDAATPTEADGGTSATLTPKAECERYLECVNQASPEQGGTTVTLYGDASACWKGSSADAQRCGDACRVARTAIANNGKKKAAACGCTGDAECKDSFCSTATGFCALTDWGDALASCKLLQAKSWKLSPPPSGRCYAVPGLRCEGIKTLRNLFSTVASDSNDRTIYLSSLQDAYKAGLSSTELIQTGVTAAILPSYAPAACKGAMTTEVYQLPEGDLPSSSDLMDFRVK